MRTVLGLVSTLAVAGAALGVVVACGGSAFEAGPNTADASALDGGADTSGAQSFCAIEGGAATFCDDFDGPPLTALWSKLDTTAGSTIQDVSAIFVSAPSSLDSTTPESLGLTAQRGRVEKTFSSASVLVISFDVHIDAVGDKPATTGGSSLVLVQLGDITVGLAANTAEVSYFEDQTLDGGDTPLVAGDIVATPTVKGTWVSANLTIDLAKAELTATVNGTTKGPVPITPSAGAGAAPQVYLGIQTRNVDAPLEAHYDNVLINVTP